LILTNDNIKTIGILVSKCRKMKQYPHLYPITIINSICIKDFNATPETTKLLEENIGEKLQDIGMGKKFWKIPQKHSKETQKNRKRLHQTKKSWQRKHSSDRRDSLKNGRKYVPTLSMTKI
jgi:hypothetical protein